MIRTGELLLEIEAAKPGPKLKSELDFNSPRQQAATQAGLSERQAKDAIAAAKVPAAEAEALAIRARATRREGELFEKGKRHDRAQTHPVDG